MGGKAAVKKASGVLTEPSPRRKRTPAEQREWLASRRGRRTQPVADSRLPALGPWPFAAAAGADENGAGSPESPKARVVAAVVLERLPVVAPDFEEWEAEYLEFKRVRDEELAAEQERLGQEYVEEQLAIRAKGGGKKKAKKEKKKQKKSGGSAADDDEAAAAAAAAGEDGDDGDATGEGGSLGTQEFPLITADDEADNRRSLYRKLTQRLYLIVKKDRTEHAWQFPQGGHDEEADGDHLRRTAERELKEEVGTDLQTFFVGNAPIGWYSYPLPEDQQAKFGGADTSNVFFYKAQYVHGSVNLNAEEGLVDYLWVTREELQEYLDPELYQHVRQSLLH